MKTEAETSTYYIVRTDKAGVFFGQIIGSAKDAIKNKSVTMTNLRKIHYWEGAGAIEQISQDGVNDSSRLTVVVPKMEIADPIQIIPCTKKATSNLINQEEWKY